MWQKLFGGGAPPGPAGGSRRSPDPLAGFRGGEGKEKKDRRGKKGGEGREGKGVRGN
jgi:hypothetical protein